MLPRNVKVGLMEYVLLVAMREKKGYSNQFNDLLLLKDSK